MPVVNQNIIAEVGRQLSLEDIALMQTLPLGSTTPKLKKIRAVHHAAARLMSTGMKNAEISMSVGLCASRLSILRNDPAFMDLVLHYELTEVERFTNVQDRMVVLGMVASEELNERIVDDPESISTKDLTEILKASLDRGGHAPITKSETKSTHIVLSAEDMLKIKMETMESQNGRVIHRRPTKTLPSDSGSSDLDDADTRGALQDSEEPKGLTLEGLDL
jgi:hypothetical protein